MTAYSIAHGDVISVLSSFRDNAFDALACDPPYGFSFMGKAWDYDVPSVELWRECLRVLKPGAPLVAFGGSRTYHRLACAVEDAGFELRDQLLFLYGKGFPKSLNIGLAIDKAAGVTREVVGTRTLTGTAAMSTQEKGGTYTAGNDSRGRSKEVAVTAATSPLAQLWDGYGTALKPAHEPIVLARKPLDGTVAQNVARWGVGGLAIDACRIGESGGLHKTALKSGDTEREDAGGRWPANLILSHTEYCRPTGQTRDVKNGTAVKHRGVVAGTGASFGSAKPVGTPDAGYGTQQVEVWECTEDCPVRLLDAEAGDRPSAPYRANDAAGAVLPMTKRTAGGYADGGGPSRFFYCSKVSTKEREAGCEGLAKKSAGEATERDDVVFEVVAGSDRFGPYPTLDDAGAVALQLRRTGREDVDIVESRPAGLDNPRAGAGRTGGARNHHPTLKPISLTTWLTRLILPPNPNAVILVPFAGAGSEMIGAVKAGWGGVFGIEREGEYVEIAKARLAHWCREAQAA